MKVLTVVGTRPEVIRLSRVIVALDEAFTHVLVHTGQNYDYELNQVFFEDLELRQPDYYLDASEPTACATIGNVIVGAESVITSEKPDAVLILGDTNSALAAVAAKRLRVPVFHMEAGNRCFDDRVPEEINRRMVDHIADVNMPYSDISRQYLLAEGLPADRIIKTGSPMYEVLTYYGGKAEASRITESLDLVDQQYFVVSAHREENVDDERHLAGFLEVLSGLVLEWGLPVVVTTHPRTRKRLDALDVRLPAGVRFLTPFGFTDYVRLQSGARAVLSDSGTISEEASILNLKAVNLRDAHERPEGMEETAAILTGLEWDRVNEALRILEKTPPGAARQFPLVADYGRPNVSKKVVRIILSYTHYVNRVVWRKS
jgi:UDP-N-acetyl-L-fucosamine synthase